MANSSADIQKLYVAYFNRPADPLGLQYWVNSSLSLTDIARSFSVQTEYADAYAGQTTAQIINNIYINLFGHAADAPGLTYWAGEVTNGLSMGVAALAILNGALGADLTAVNAKAAAAASFTAAVDTTPEIVAYAGATAVAAAKAWLTPVVDATTLAAAQATQDATIATIVATGGVAGQTFTLTAGVDNIVGTTGNDTISSGTTLFFNALDSINGGAGTDTLNVSDSAAAIATAGRTVTNVEVANLSSGLTAVANTTGWTGLTTLATTSTGGAIVTAAATTDVTVTDAGVTAADNVITINGGKNISVVASGTTDVGLDGATEITIGATTAAVGTVTVTNSFTGTNAQVQADVGVTGGTVVTVTESLGNVTGNTTTTQGKVLVTGSALTTNVVVNQAAAVTAAAAVVGGNAAKVGVVNGTVTITDGNSTTAATDTITSVTLNSYGASTIDSTVLATLNLAGTGGTLGLNKATADTTGTATTLALNVTGGAVLGAISGTHAADITKLNVTTTGTTASTIANATFTGVTALAVSGTSKLTLTDNTFAALQTVTAGDGGLAMGTTALANTVLFTGGAGDDAFFSGATTKAQTLGAGANTVTLTNGVTAMGTGGSITAGAGTSDTLKFATTADAVTLSTAGAVQTAFKAAVTGFERLSLAAVGGSVEVDVAGVLGTTNGSYVTTVGSAAGTLTLKNLVTSGTGATVVINNTNGTNNTGVTLTGTSGAGGSDIVNLLLNDTATATVVTFGTLTAANVENVNIVINDARVAGLAVPAQAISTATITDAQMTTLTVSGNQSLNLTHSGGTALTSVNASGLTLGGLTFTSNASQYATTYTGSLLGGDVVSFATATAGVTGTETAGTNSLTGSATAANTLTGGTGADTLIGGVAADTLVGGAGADTISTQATGTLSGAADQITLGTGNDTVILRGDVAASGAMTVAVATAAAARITDFSISGTNGVDILSLSATKGNYNGAATNFSTHVDANAAGATVVMNLGAASAGTALTASTDLIHLTSATAVTGTLQQLFNAAIGTSTATGISTADFEIFFSVYDSTNSKMLVGVVDAGADTVIATGDVVTLVGSIDMTAANYALFTNANLAIVAA